MSQLREACDYLECHVWSKLWGNKGIFGNEDSHANSYYIRKFNGKDGLSISIHENDSGISISYPTDYENSVLNIPVEQLRKRELLDKIKAL